MIDVGTCANAACMHAASQNVGRWVGKTRRVTVHGPKPGHFPTAAHDLQCCSPKIEPQNGPARTMGTHREGEIVNSQN